MDSMNASIPTLMPHKITAKKNAFSTKIVEFENGVEQRFMNWRTPKKNYELSWNLLSKEQYESLEGFFDSQGGCLKKWTITDSRLGVINVRFAKDSLDSKLVRGIYYNVTTEVITC